MEAVVMASAFNTEGKFCFLFYLTKYVPKKQYLKKSNGC